MASKTHHSERVRHEKKINKKRADKKSKTSTARNVNKKISINNHEKLKKALTDVIHGTYHEDRYSHSGNAEEMDAYGKGSPTDRIQFGYAPAIAEEAVAFHSRCTAQEWVDTRRRIGRCIFLKKQKFRKLNCEPLTSLLKLKNYWNELEAFNTDLRKSHFNADEADRLLDMLASRQRVDNVDT